MFINIFLIDFIKRLFYYNTYISQIKRKWMSKLKKLTSLEVNTILSALEDLLELKVLFRKIAPNYQFDELTKQNYLLTLSNLYNKIQPIFLKHLPQIESNKLLLQKELQFLDEIKRKNNKILVSASSSKKLLKRLGFNPLNIIVSGGPLLDKNYKKINPNLSNQVLLGIKKRSQHTLNLLQNNEEPLIFIYEIQNLSDEIILNELKNCTELVGKQIITYKVSSWKALDTYSEI